MEIGLDINGVRCRIRSRRGVISPCLRLDAGDRFTLYGDDPDELLAEASALLGGCKRRELVWWSVLGEDAPLYATDERRDVAASAFAPCEARRIAADGALFVSPN